MTPAAFKDWRLRNDLTQIGAAELLGLHERTVRAYEKGVNWRGDKAEVPKAVCLACWAIEKGQEEWDGHSG